MGHISTSDDEKIAEIVKSDQICLATEKFGDLLSFCASLPRKLSGKTDLLYLSRSPLQFESICSFTTATSSAITILNLIERTNHELPAAILLLLLFFSGKAHAQSSIEYGEPEELQGITKIFVDTGTDLSGRDNIIKVIKTELPNVVIVSRVEEAEIVLIYSSNSYSILSGISNSRNSSTNGTVSVGKYRHVFRPNKLNFNQHSDIQKSYGW